jgi:hypothetical protein
MGLTSGVYSQARATDPVKVYENASKGGTSASFDRVGRFNMRDSTTKVNDSSISSIDVSPGWSVEAMKAGKNPGDVSNKMFTGYTPIMPSGWNDVIDEIVIYKTPAPAPAPVSGTGQEPTIVNTSSEDLVLSPDEGNAWWIWLIVVIILIFMAVGVYMFTKKPVAPL